MSGRGSRSRTNKSSRKSPKSSTDDDKASSSTRVGSSKSKGSIGRHNSKSVEVVDPVLVEEESNVQPGNSDNGSLPAVLLSNFCKVRPDSTRCLPELEYEGARHLHPERLPSARPDKPSTLRIEEMNEENFTFLLTISPVLRRLDLSSNRITGLPKELVEKWTQLERLILDKNRLKSDSFPDNFTDLKSLKELSVAFNQILEIAEVWTKMKSIQRLNIQSNRLHNLKGVEKLTKLVCLIADNQSISVLHRDFYNMKRLEYIYLSHNKISALAANIKTLGHLRIIDLSYNNLHSLPGELFTLSTLEQLIAHHNQINRIPTINLKSRRAKQKVACIDISCNSISRFPEHLVAITQSLDLSSNKIKTIPTSLLKRLDWNTDLQLDISENPIFSPPREICQQGIRAMVQYYHETKLETKTYQGLKVLFLGGRGSGKTSLIYTMIDQQPRLMDHDEGTSKGIEIYDMAVDGLDDENHQRTLSLSCWDFSGDPFYHGFSMNFMQLPALALMTVNLGSYKQEKFRELIGVWLELLITRNNRLVVLLVGTCSDSMPSKQAATTRLSEIRSDMEDFLKNYLDRIDDEIMKMESLLSMSGAQSELYKQFIELKGIRVLIYPESVVTSSKKAIGMERLEEVLLDFAVNTKTFERVMQIVPSLWLDVESFLEDRSIDEPLFNLPFFVELVGNKFGLKGAAKKIAQYLHETGNALWIEGDQCFSEQVVISPSIILECCRLLLRPDLDAFLHQPGDPDEFMKRYIKLTSTTPAAYLRVVKEFVEEGILDPELLQAIWSRSVSTHLIGHVLCFLCTQLLVAYPIGKRTKDGGNYNLSPLALYSTLDRRRKRAEMGALVDSSDTPQSGLQTSAAPQPGETSRDETQDSAVFISSNLPRVLFPIYCRQEQPPDQYQRDWLQLTSTSTEIAPGYWFPRISPEGIFERCLVIFHDFERFKLRYICQWRDGVQMRSLEYPCGLRLFRQTHPDGSCLIRFAIVYDPEIARLMKVETEGEEGNTALVWANLLPMLSEFETFLKQYPGLWYRRMMQCPMCKELTFMGEWKSPKETQSYTHKTCQLCDKEVETMYLVQPKEKRKVTSPEEILKMKQAMREKREKIMADRKKKSQSMVATPTPTIIERSVSKTIIDEPAS